MAPETNRESWLERFATKLLLLHPKMSALQAAHAAAEEFERSSEFDPESVAMAYLEGSKRQKQRAVPTAPPAINEKGSPWPREVWVDLFVLRLTKMQPTLPLDLASAVAEAEFDEGGWQNEPGVAADNYVCRWGKPPAKTEPSQ
jgi:hypothetical protein